MSEAGKAIRVGSIIHLENGFQNGGFLDMRGWVTDKPVILHWENPDIRGLVSTHKDKNRLLGSGSWEILSVTGKPVGAPLEIGDRIRLRNMYSDAGYLDTFEWVRNLKPFKDYPMRIGVFTSSFDRGGSGESGEWTILSVENKPDGTPLFVGDRIYLKTRESRFNAGYLYTYSEGVVTDHPLFSDYEGQQKFVFTSPLERQEHGCREWTISLSSPPESLYYMWGESEGRWLDFGALKFPGLLSQAIISLKLGSIDEGQTLVGEVAYSGEWGIDIAAEWIGQNNYRVRHRLNNEEESNWYPNGKWILGGRDDKRIVHFDVRSGDNGRSFNGTIRYADDPDISIRGVRATTTLFNKKQRTLLYDFFEPALWQARTRRIREALDTAVLELEEILLNENLIDTLTKEPLPLPEKESPDVIDFAYQVRQLVNLHTLWLSMNEFWQLLSETSIQSMQQLTAVHILPPVHRIRECFRQFTIDFEILQSAIQQRRWAGNTEKRSGGNFQAVSLVITDKLAARALAPYQYLLSDTAHLIPITYFSKTIHIRQLPYTDYFVFVGLTYDLAASIEYSLATRSPAFELMAIPHEVGHFIYHNANLGAGKKQVTFADLSKQFDDNPYYHWCEEIFADLYGCVVAGPLAILGLQALLAASDPERVLLDDEEHPTLIIRPFFLTEMLRILHRIAPEQYDFLDIAMILDANWTAVLQRWGFVAEKVINGRPARIHLPGTTKSHTEQTINLDKMLRNMLPMIEYLAKLLLTKAKFDPWETTASENELSANIPWCPKQETLTHYVDQLQELAGQNFARKKFPYNYLNPKHQLKQRTINALSSILDESNEQMSAQLFQLILDGWQDSGPTGGSGGTHI